MMPYSFCPKHAAVFSTAARRPFRGPSTSGTLVPFIPVTVMGKVSGGVFTLSTPYR
jgi:hypothetical protein